MQVRLSLEGGRVSIQQHGEEDSATQVEGEAMLQLAASYYAVLARRVGGSETFQEKRQFFYTELQRHHSELNHKHVRLQIRHRPIKSCEWL